MLVDIADVVLFRRVSDTGPYGECDHVSQTRNIHLKVTLRHNNAITDVELFIGYTSDVPQPTLESNSRLQNR